MLVMVMLTMTLRVVCMSKRAIAGHNEWHAIDQRHKPDEPHGTTSDIGAHHDFITGSSLYDIPDNMSTDACSPMLHLITQFGAITT